ncbi:SRPBCC family protein [Teredinibacter turnerae]|uniref:SRPBCC family protein n=1 Tax=Teredinibacter turnerae TaxID=2426 RepID=UPI0005F839F2|nr:SRPBCC family protein [Teredinibacter turnerae]
MDEKLDIEISRVLKAPRDIVWQAWRDPANLVQWWAPKPVVTESIKHEFYSGGGFGTLMRMEDGSEFASEGCFLQVVENEKIIFSDALSGGWRPNASPFMTAIITLEDHPEGTAYSAQVLHNSEEARQRHLDMGFFDGWGTVFEQLDSFVQQLKN